MVRLGYLFISTIFLGIILGGCSTTRIVQDTETTVRDTTITVVPPAIRDTLNANTLPDSTVQGVHVQGKDTVTVVRYYPKEKRITVYVKPDTLRVVYHDTTQVVKNTIIEKPALISEILGLLFPTVLILGIIYVISRFVR